MKGSWLLDLPALALVSLLPLAGCAFDGGGESGGELPGEGDTGGGEGGGGDGEGGGDGDGDPGGGGDPVQFRECTALPYVAAEEPAGFEWTSNSLVAATGWPNHHAQDVVIAADQVGSVSAVFTYGALVLDIVDEAVRVSLDECSGWRDLGLVRTDDDGRVEVALSEKLPVGVYHVVFEVLADGTTASAYLWSLPAGTHLAVFDIDGTLTTADTELFKDILLGDYTPQEYAGAAALTRAHVEAGHVPVYLTGRPGFLAGATRTWLDERDFAHGIVRLTDRAGQVLPTDGGVGAFKRDVLLGLSDTGMAVDLGYGNAATDIFAYLSAGLAPDEVWIIGDRGGDEGTHAVSPDWTARAAEVAEGEVEQPFVR